MKSLRRWKKLSQDNVLSMLGLCKRAGKVVSGEFSTEKAVKEKKAKLVIVATDASDNTKKLFRNKCTFYNVPFYMYSKKADLGHSLGQEMRTSVAVLDDNFANAVIQKLNNM